LNAGNSTWVCKVKNSFAVTSTVRLADRHQVNILDQESKRKKEGESADKENAEPRDNAQQAAEKSDESIQQEIQSLFRQITASVTFLPMLDGNCTFNVLVYADADSEVPLEWGDSDAKEVKNAEKVMLRSFSTNNHRIDTVVSYRSVQLGRRASVHQANENHSLAE
jgi:hypothetical protein